MMTRDVLATLKGSSSRRRPSAWLPLAARNPLACHSDVGDSSFPVATRDRSSQGISHTAIQKRAKAEGWERDLGAKIKAKAESPVAKREVAKSVATETTGTVREGRSAGIQA